MSSVTGKAPSVKLPPHVATARALLLEQLGRLLTTEEVLAKTVLPQLTLELDDERLEQAVSAHASQTRGHAGRVKEAFLALGEMPAGRPVVGLDGLLAERQGIAPDVAACLRPFLACVAAMGIEHYEINAYEAAIRLTAAVAASEVGAPEVSRLLRANLEDEIATLQALGEEADRLRAQLP